jgi:alpha-galactosidase
MPFTRLLAVSAVGFFLGALAEGADSGPTEAEILTPRPGPEPRINGPLLHGCRPGHPFLWRVPCTGDRPIRFSATGLPDGWTLDPDSGILLGTAPAATGTYTLSIEAENAQGRARRTVRIVVGKTLALTPPMGWNDWYIHYDRVTDSQMRHAADAMIASGMADFGYNYVNIDDCWMIKPGSSDPELAGAERDARGAIRPNKRFPDMKALADDIHAKGLRAGLYSSPGPRTCCDFVGSYGHEEIDAQTFSAWGFDFLKYDWCSYGAVAGGSDRAHLTAPYRKMGAVLAKLDRDIVFNLCQYGMGEVWTWGGEVGGQCWRTTGDLGVEAGDHLPGFYHIGLSNARHAEQAGPGRWNDPDYLLIGVVGNARNSQIPARSTTLTPDEQYSYMSLWSLMAAPLFFSGDMELLDRFTLNVLCNTEVIAIDQDPLGRQARIVRESDHEILLAKPLEDGSLAVGLFNLDEEPRLLSVTWTELGIAGPRTVRDVWRQRDLASAEAEFTTPVTRHGVELVRLRQR